MDKNTKLFIAFRVLFNCRFYYPIFAILFLDFGLSLEEFSLLNVIWAFSIVLAEVPSGALADLVGRRKLIIYASVFMILEMLVLILAPRSGEFVFHLFVLNRVFSGLAEAAASGADEALAYDSLKGNASEKEMSWAKVLSKTMRFQSIGMVLAMLGGAYLYDWKTLVETIPWWESMFSRDFSLRIPILLNLLTAIACFFVALSFKDIAQEKVSRVFALRDCQKIVKKSFAQVFQAAQWIYKSRFVFSFILLCVVFDSSIRVFITLGSRYYRFLDIPEFYFGPIGALMAFLGIVSAPLAEKLVKKCSVKVNYCLMAVLLLGAFYLLTLVNNLWGLALTVVITIAMNLVGFYMSYYLNREAPSEMRATLLSYKGLAINLAYAWVGIVYAWEARRVGDEFVRSFPFFYKYFLLMLLVFFLIRFFHGRTFLDFKQKPG